MVITLLKAAMNVGSLLKGLFTREGKIQLKDELGRVRFRSICNTDFPLLVFASRKETVIQFRTGGRFDFLKDIGWTKKK